ARGKLSDEAVDAALAHLDFYVGYEHLADRDLVIEAITEDEPTKLGAFAALDEVCAVDDAIFASNTSSIPIAKLAAATNRPDRVVGLHFFNPVPVLPLVEVIPSLTTSQHTIDVVRSLAIERLGKHVIQSPDRAGFVVNALLIPYLLSAIRMLEEGFA